MLRLEPSASMLVITSLAWLTLGLNAEIMVFLHFMRTNRGNNPCLDSASACLFTQALLQVRILRYLSWTKEGALTIPLLTGLGQCG